jgi:hypothetical protein
MPKIGAKKPHKTGDSQNPEILKMRSAKNDPKCPQR